MTIQKNGSGTRSKNTQDAETTWLRSEEAVHGVREPIRSMNMITEQKITLDDGINNLAEGVESMMDRIDMASSTTDQKFTFCL